MKYPSYIDDLVHGNREQIPCLFDKSNVTVIKNIHTKCRPCYGFSNQIDVERSNSRFEQLKTYQFMKTRLLNGPLCTLKQKTHSIQAVSLNIETQIEQYTTYFFFK